MFVYQRIKNAKIGFAIFLFLILTPKVHGLLPFKNATLNAFSINLENMPFIIAR